jgi:hypothetical protein
MGRGGRRVGAGRKPKPRVDGMPPFRVVPVSVTSPVPTTNPVSPIEEFDAPDDLTFEERAVWLKQAPHAFRNRTLTRASAMSFERYCKVVVLERNESKSSGMGGPNHRGLLKQVNAFELQFMLTAAGKAMVEPAPPKPVDQDEEFFGPRAVTGARAG